MKPKLKQKWHHGSFNYCIALFWYINWWVLQYLLCCSILYTVSLVIVTENDAINRDYLAAFQREVIAFIFPPIKILYDQHHMATVQIKKLARAQTRAWALNLWNIHTIYFEIFLLLLSNSGYSGLLGASSRILCTIPINSVGHNIRYTVLFF